MVNLAVWIFQGYLTAGLIFAVAFAVKGASAIDQDVSASPKTFRLLLIPGAILLWPVLLTKWVRA